MNGTLGTACTRGLGDEDEATLVQPLPRRWTNALDQTLPWHVGRSETAKWQR